MMKSFVISVLVFSVLSFSNASAQSASTSPSMIPGVKQGEETKIVASIIEFILLYKMMEQPTVVPSEGGALVVFGNKMSKYDKDLNLVKEVKMNLDVKGMREMVAKVAKEYSQEAIGYASGLQAAGGSSVGRASGFGSAKWSADTALAKATLRAISTAAESYATANQGKYPTSMQDLTGATPAYLSNNYCDTEIASYRYTCKFQEDRYEVIAVPVSGSAPGATTYTITTGGVLTP